MTTWLFEDGTELTLSDGVLAVSGSNRLAAELRSGARATSQRRPRSVSVAAEPGGSVDLDVTSLWLVDKWAKDEARFFGVDLRSSDYAPNDSDIPANVAELRARSNDAPEGAVY